MNRPPADTARECEHCGRSLSERAAELSTPAGCLFCRSDGGSE